MVRSLLRNNGQIIQSLSIDTFKARVATEAIDMGRRGLHNEGSEILRERLNGRIELDFDTARRLFTLLCVLDIRG